MYWFKKMIEVAKADGIRLADQENTEYHRAKCDPSLFFKQVEKAYPFVFVPTNDDIQSVPDNDFTNPIDSPFEAISIEIMGPRPISTAGGLAEIYCILHWEIEPGTSAQFVLIDGPAGVEVLSTRSCHELVRKMLERIDVEQDGVQNVRHRIRLGSGKTKRIHTIRKIIYVQPKRKRDRAENIDSIPIDFSCRFVRRGHWRTKGMEGKIGKNREGDYCVQNKTWVNQTKPIGPEDKPLIKKTRVVSS